MVNDVTIIAGLALTFVLIGWALPYINSDLGVTDSTMDIDTSDISSGGGVDEEPGIWDVISSIGSMFVWSFGALPIWLDYIFIILRALFWFTVARNIWVGGGG